MFNLPNGKVILKFNNSVLVQKMFSSLYINFILNLYIVYKLNTWPRNTTNNLTLNIFLFDTAKLTRNADKNKFTCNGQGIAFDGKRYCRFNNDTARNVTLFGVDKSSSSHIDNPKNNCLVLGEGPTEGINGSAGRAEKKLVLTNYYLLKQKQNFA